MGVGLAAAVATTVAAQPYYPYYYPGYSYPPYGYPAYGYPAGYTWGYGWPYGWSNYYPAPAYRTVPAYSDPYVWWRPYSDHAGPVRVAAFNRCFASFWWRMAPDQLVMPGLFPAIQAIRPGDEL
jgi:hypothetical protein